MYKDVAVYVTEMTPVQQSYLKLLKLLNKNDKIDFLHYFSALFMLPYCTVAALCIFVLEL